MRIVVRVPRARSRLGRFLGISLGAHALAVAVLLFLPFLRPKADLIPQDASFVELTGAITTPARAVAPAPPAAAPATPEPPEPEGAHAVEKIPPPPTKKDDRKKKPEPKKPVPPRASAPPSSPGSAAAGTAPPGSPAAGPTGITALEGADPGLAWYNAAVAGALENAWVKPPLEGVSGVQSVIVAFEIGADGNVFNVRIDGPSGIASLDRSALRAVQDAAPFPAPPPASRGGSVRQRIRFDLRPESP